jgi:hypothetical protein
MLMTPMMVRSLVGSGLQSMSSNIGATSVAAMAAGPARIMKARKAQAVIDAKREYMNNRFGSNNEK